MTKAQARAQQAPFIAEHLSQLVGKTVKQVVYHPIEGDVDDCWALEFTDGTIAWIVKDPEGNTGGWLDIVPAKLRS